MIWCLVYVNELPQILPALVITLNVHQSRSHCYVKCNNIVRCVLEALRVLYIATVIFMAYDICVRTTNSHSLLSATTAISP